MLGIKPTDITKLISAYRLIAPPGPTVATLIPLQALTGILTACFNLERGIGGLNFVIHLEEQKNA